MSRLRLHKLNIPIGDEPPAEFQIFERGWNRTSKGSFLFDAESAKAVMAAFEHHGADLMIDLEHLSLENPAESRNFDPDARAWCRLELRDGALWAVAVSWTPDGNARLTDRRQRYISPAFNADKKTKRIVELVNIAITAMPATHGLEPLVAANERHTMANDAAAVDIAKVAEGMGLDLASIAAALGLDKAASLEDLAASVDALGGKLKAIAGLGSPPPSESPAPDAAATAAPGAEDPDKQEMSALRATILRETGAATPVMALSQISTWKASHLAKEEAETKLRKERAALELSERKTLAAELVKLGKETPHTSGLAYNKLAEHLAEMPIVKLRDRVADFKRAPGGTPPAGSAPVGPTGETVMVGEVAVELSALEVQRCVERKADKVRYAEIKLRQGNASAVTLEG